jgi:hypothetical protein
MKRLSILVLALGVVAACTSGDGDSTPTMPPTSSTPPGSATPGSTTGPRTTTTTPAASTTTATTTIPATTAPPQAKPRPRRLAAFADFTAVPLLTTGQYAGPARPASLTDVLLPSSISLEADAAATLLRQGFVVEPAPWPVPEFFVAYQSYGYEDDVYFVTTDVAYHYLHLAFSKVLRETEEQVLLPILEELILGGLDAARAQEAELAGSDVADPAGRVTQLFEAAATLAGLDVGPIGPLASAEVALAASALELTASPITSFRECRPDVSAAGCVDYSLFKPRGHYTRSPDLERFFRAMSLLGQASFFLDQPQSVQLGLLASRVLTSAPDLLAAWEKIFEPTAFMVGAADDFTPLEVEQAAAGLTDPGRFGDPAFLDEVVAGLLATREVAINPEAAAIRVMGARFVVDSWILDQMVWPNVGTVDDRRVVASPLDLAAAFGSGLAYDIQDAAGETGYQNYDGQLAEMQSFVAERPAPEWAATVYDAWLYALEAMWAAHGAPFPEFMRSEAWAAKNLQTAFGSYAELKHDTILYAKQSFAAEGEFPPAAFEPRHWVEPDPVAFRRMAGVLDLLQRGLAERGLLSPENDALLQAITDMTERFARIAADELEGRPITAADNRWLNAIASLLEALWLQSSDWDPNDLEPGPSDEDVDAAIVADIARNLTAYLEIATGSIDTIYVLVPNDEGRFQVAKGAVYSYYEFWQPAELGRLTDEEWRAMLLAGDVPPRPSWQDVLFPSPAP